MINFYAVAQISLQGWLLGTLFRGNKNRQVPYDAEISDFRNRIKTASKD
jgi:hypothetical protein